VSDAKRDVPFVSRYGNDESVSVSLSLSRVANESHANAMVQLRKTEAQVSELKISNEQLSIRVSIFGASITQAIGGKERSILHLERLLEQARTKQSSNAAAALAELLQGIEVELTHQRAQLQPLRRLGKQHDLLPPPELSLASSSRALASPTASSPSTATTITSSTTSDRSSGESSEGDTSPLESDGVVSPRSPRDAAELALSSSSSSTTLQTSIPPTAASDTHATTSSTTSTSTTSTSTTSSSSSAAQPHRVVVAPVNSVARRSDAASNAIRTRRPTPSPPSPLLKPLPLDKAATTQVAAIVSPRGNQPLSSSGSGGVTTRHHLIPSPRSISDLLETSDSETEDAFQLRPRPPILSTTAPSPQARTPSTVLPPPRSSGLLRAATAASAVLASKSEPSMEMHADMFSNHGGGGGTSAAASRELSPPQSPASRMLAARIMKSTQSVGSSSKLLAAGAGRFRQATQSRRPMSVHVGSMGSSVAEDEEQILVDQPELVRQRSVSDPIVPSWDMGLGTSIFAELRITATSLDEAQLQAKGRHGSLGERKPEIPIRTSLGSMAPRLLDSTEVALSDSSFGRAYSTCMYVVVVVVVVVVVAQWRRIERAKRLTISCTPPCTQVCRTRPELPDSRATRGQAGMGAGDLEQFGR